MTLSLRQCIEAGLEANMEVRQRGLQMEVSEIQLKQSRLNLFPDVNAFINHGINQGRSIDPFSNAFINQQVNFAGYGINSGVILFNGFSLKNQVKQSKLGYEASRMELQQSKDNLTINIILAYLQVLGTQDMHSQSLSRSILTKNQLDRLSLLNKEGAIAPSVLTDMQGQYAEDRLTIVNARNSLEISRITLFQLINMPYDSAIKLERLDTTVYKKTVIETSKDIYQTALREFSLLKAIDLRAKSAEKAVRVAKGQLFPTLSLQAIANSNYSDAARNEIFLNTIDIPSNDYVIINGNNVPVFRKQNNFRSDKISYGSQLNNNLFTTFSLNLSIPLFNSLQGRNRIKLAKITLRENKLLLETTKTQLQHSIEQAYTNMITISEKHEILVEQVNAFAESYRAAEIRFNNGLGTTVEFLTAKNNLDRAQVNLINARYDLMLRQKILDYYQGKSLW
jgi:outer membrane protein